MASLTKDEWKAVLYCTPERPITGRRDNLAHPYVYRNASDQTISESLVLKLVNKGVLHGRPVQPGLSPELHFTLTERGEAARVLGTEAFERRTKRTRGAG